jgi:hypothetical protein
MQWVRESDDVPNPVDRESEGVEAKHALLSSADLDMVRHTRVRLLGWAGDVYSPRQRTADIRAFQNLEQEQVTWLGELRSKKNIQGPRGVDGLTPTQRAALQLFQTDGGHAFPLRVRDINGANSKGVVLLAELETRRGIHELIGTITALSETPFTRRGMLNRDYPQFDLRDAVPDAALEQACAGAHARIVIWRTTVRKQIEDHALRRLGVGARLKDVLLRLALQHQKNTVTFNIGSVYNRGDPQALDALAVNEPSLKHNNWARDWGLRRRYSTPLLPDSSRQEVDLHMLWRAFHAEIKDGLDAFEGVNGILSRKGILDVDGVDMRADADRIFRQVAWEEQSNKRLRPWAHQTEA